MLNHLLTFILRLYSDPSLPRNVVDIIIEFLDNFLKNVYVPMLRDDILKMLEKENVSSLSLRKIDNCFKEYSLICSDVKTETQRFHLLKKKGLLDLEKFKIGTRIKQHIVGNDTLLKMEDMFGVGVPLRKSLRWFLQIPGVFYQIIDYIESLSKESHLISNIMQANLWKKKYVDKYTGDIVLPLYIFCDDLEVGNALGSHAGTDKFAAIYAMIACLPPNLASLLSCIIFYGLFRTLDKKETNNRKVFQNLITELNFLSRNGIIVDIKGTIKRVKFQLILFIGDNLGLNSFFGFQESFRSRYYCRICRCSSAEASEMCVEKITRKI